MSVERRPASLTRRVGAYLVDGVVATVVVVLGAGVFAGVSFATEGAFPLAVALVLGYVVALLWFAFYTWMQGGGGSIGMRMTGLQLAHAADDQPLGFGRALGRNLVWGLGCAIVVGYVSVFFDSSPWRRGWHDKASGAVMTDIAGRGPAAPAPAGSAIATPAGAAAAMTDAGVAAPDRPVFPSAPPLPPFGAGPSHPPAAVPAPPLPSGVPLAPASPASAPAAPAAPAEETVIAGARPVATADVISFVPGVTGPRAAPVPAVDRRVAPSDAPPPDGDTRLSAPARPLVRLAWDDDTRQAVYGRTLFGRNPAAEPGAAVSPIRDETLSLSKTHFEITIDDGVAWVTDRHSTNGVVIRRGAGRQTVAAGEPVRVRAGDVLEFGDRHVMIEVAP